MDDILSRIKHLALWSGPVDPLPLIGGITNHSFTVVDGARKFVVRCGADIPVHQVVRFNELAASRAAHAAGLSPAVIHAEPGVMVLDFIEGRTLAPADIAAPANRARIVAMLRCCHHTLPQHLDGPVLAFWVFHVLRHYHRVVTQGGGRMARRLPDLARAAAHLEGLVGPSDIVFGHNDLLAANWLDDGDRFWLIDWDYAGFNSPLFDLANLASNNDFAKADEVDLLAAYFEAPVDEALWRRYTAMKCASLLRETMWSMAAELHATIDFDYAAYTDRYLARFERDYENAGDILGS